MLEFGTQIRKLKNYKQRSGQHNAHLIFVQNITAVYTAANYRRAYTV